MSEGPKVAGHTATVVGDTMLIIGGYDPDVGFSDRVVQYNIATKIWSDLTYGGPSPKGFCSVLLFCFSVSMYGVTVKGTCCTEGRCFPFFKKQQLYNPISKEVID